MHRGEPTVMDLIREKGIRSAPAIVEPSGNIVSYAEMLSHADRVRDAVIESVDTDACVAVLMPRGTSHIASLLGVLDAGRVAVLIDPAHPVQRVHQMLADAEIDLVLTTTESASYPLGAWKDKELSIVGLRPATQRVSRCAESAYVIFTSGSTGRPKGVRVSHPGLLEHTRASISYFGMSQSDVTVQFAAPGFDVVIEEVFPTLAAGGSLVVRPDALWTPYELVEFLHLRRVTNLELPAGYWAALFWDPEIRLDLTPNPELRFVNVGGEKTTLAALSNWRDSPFGAIPLYNSYGPTEVVVTSNVFRVPFDLTPGMSDTVPLGPPLGRRTMHVLDPQDPFGAEVAEGELAVGGTIADGYVSLPSETARRFITLSSGERVYRTGDRVRRIEPGGFEFLGRLDDQIKVRGYRVELGEIEAVVRALPSVFGVAAATDPRGTGVVAAVVLDSPSSLIHVEQAIRHVLPEYMVPRLIAVSSLPKLPNDKLDRGAVSALFG